jgi:hypothetical protein
MPDSPRLAELRRQRALIQQHLAWLEREIASADTATAPAARSTASANVPPSASSNKPAAAPDTSAKCIDALSTALPVPAETEAEAILDQYRTPTDALQHDVRTGCLLYFVGAFVLLAGVVAVLYFALKH